MVIMLQHANMRKELFKYDKAIIEYKMAIILLKNKHIFVIYVTMHLVKYIDFLNCIHRGG